MSSNLGSRLANIAGKYSKESVAKRSRENLQAKIAALGITRKNNRNNTSLSIRSTSPTSSVNSSAQSTGSTSPRSNTCVITPGGQKMRRVNGKWVKCAMGGAKRKTRRSKKSKRVTRRRR